MPIRRLTLRLGMLGQFFRYLWKERMWRLIPMVITLDIVGVLVVFSRVPLSHRLSTHCFETS